jgi:photosystem II stability/assembly factor-like uncharacterized protein
MTTIAAPPPPSQYMRIELSAPSADVVWALTTGLYVSIDGGATWQLRSLPSTHAPNAEISFVDDHEGWFATGGVPETQCNGAGTSVWHTSDGARSWQELVVVDYEHMGGGGIGYRQCKQGLSFVDTRQGFLAASDPNFRPTIYRTSDGGRNWTGTTLPDPPGYATLAGGDALGPGLVRRFGSTLLLPAWGMQPNAQMETEYIFRSLDSGATWTSIAATGNGSNNVTLVTLTRWLKISNAQPAFETTDGGRTWHAFITDYQVVADDPSVFVFGDAQVGYATVGSTIRRTLDGGSHWTLINTPGT